MTRGATGVPSVWPQRPLRLTKMLLSNARLWTRIRRPALTHFSETEKAEKRKALFGKLPVRISRAKDSDGGDREIVDVAQCRNAVNNSTPPMCEWPRPPTSRRGHKPCALLLQRNDVCSILR